MDLLDSKRLFPWAAAGCLLAMTAGCASLRAGDERVAYYTKEAGSFTYAKRCLDAWPSVLKVLGAHGYPLQGRDRQYAGEGKQSGFQSFVDQGDETQAVEGGGLTVLTGWLAAAEGRSRYQVTGNPGTPTGCTVTFIRIFTGTIDPANDRRETDWKIQMELMRQIQPDAAVRIDAGAPKGG
ncbi:MAG: hypothetical protein WCK73_00080 [Deltaproteobacteria bacterium]